MLSFYNLKRDSMSKFKKSKSSKEEYVHKRAIDKFETNLFQKILNEKEQDLLRYFKVHFDLKIHPIMENIKKGETQSQSVKEELESLSLKLPAYYNTSNVKEFRGDYYLEVWIQYAHRWEYDKWEFGDFDDEDEYEYYYYQWEKRGDVDANLEIDAFNKKYPKFVMKRLDGMGDKGHIEFQIRMK